MNINRYEGAVLYLQSKVITINLFCFGLPVLTYLTLFWQDMLGITDTFTCWIRSERIAVGLVVFYLPLFLCIFYSLFVYIILWNKLKNISNLSSYPDINLLKNYPLVLLVAYFAGSVYRVMGASGVPPEDTEVLQVIHSGLSGTMGFFNCILFSVQPVVKVKIKALYHDLFRRKGGAGKSTKSMKNLSRPNYQAKAKGKTPGKDWIVLTKSAVQQD